MIGKVFSYFPGVERLTRTVLYRHPGIKQKIKSKLGHGKVNEKAEYNEAGWQDYQDHVRHAVKDHPIVLVHSSMDGLNPIGVTVEQMLDFLLSLTADGHTVVIPAYAISSQKVTDGRLKKYDPQKSPCWTGMLPNYFIRTPGVIRTVYPYNSLAAIGPEASAMMADNDQQVYVYGDHSAWKYCVDQHAAVLFIGTTADEANTIQSHMIPDVMGERWPIRDWYQEVVCPVKTDIGIVEKTILIQKDEWVQYVADYHMTRKLKKEGILKEELISGCPFGCVDDANAMVDCLVKLAEQGDLSFRVPGKYRK